MAAYVALYRKYRPQGFADVIGQGHVTETLAREVQSGKVAHAYLFAGPRGTGKTTTARILAKALNCTDRRPDGEPCNACASCAGITSGSSMDVIELDAASHNKVEDVRDIRANVGTVASVGGARRVYILDEAHMLSRAAANALLKTLEEPPEHAHFVLATTEPYKLPDTIRSRAQRFDFHPIGSEVLIDHLDRVATAEAMKADHEGLALIARHAAGSARDALGLLEQVAALGGGRVDPAGVARALGLAGDDAYERLVRAVASQDAVAGLTLVADLASGGTDLRRFIADGLELFRGMFLTQYAPNVAEIVDDSAERISMWRELSRVLGPSDVLRCIDRLGDALADLREGREERLVVELTVLRLCRPEAADDVAAVVARVDRLEERLRRLQGVHLAEGTEAQGRQPAPPSAAPRPLILEQQSAAEIEGASPHGATGNAEPAPSKQGQPAQAAPEDDPPGDLSIESVSACWPAVAGRLREVAGARRFALFQEARPVAVEAGAVILEVPANLPFHLSQLQEDDALNAIIVTALGDAMGGRVALKYRAGEPLSATSATPEPGRVPDKDSLVESGEGAIDAVALMTDLLDGEVVE